MRTELIELRQQTIAKILAKQDEGFRWGFNPKNARERPEYLYYSPNFKSTLWTLVLLADLQATAGEPQIQASIELVQGRFFDQELGIFGLPERIRFPIPCLNGNMIYLHHYFETEHREKTEKTIQFFDTAQRFDDGGFKTPKTFPYFSNSYCYGKHTCFWGVTKLFKGISFIPKSQRSPEAQHLLENCIEFVLHHGVCFSSHQRDAYLHPDISQLRFPNFYTSDFLEILWLLAREGVQDQRTARALDLLRAKMKDGGVWVLEKALNTIVSAGLKGNANGFITERARWVLDYYS